MSFLGPKTPLLLNLFIGLLHFSEFLFSSFDVSFIHVLDLIGVIFFGHGPESFLHLGICGRFVDLQDSVGIVGSFEEHGVQALKILHSYAKVAGNLSYLPCFGLAYAAIGICDTK